ncbi:MULTISPECIES: hypothetical protein [unclassified Streptomyces]|uniref:Uncharacterized protein n=1 Tax=Streptomyces johnsoniae TaxID=3075532 RepID=A0ABU2S9L3_9ACTN|nr:MULTISPECIES: hypothetical protein [unclassified Streptomyces]MDT0445673.1 hypothetical protein [Streptomyces sp. DSM 41886]ONK15343.1 hypothetical protein STBA_61590 [Streptomyces sp. MP131-18]
MRSSYERPAPSATPIYDALCAEYRRLFRALPGDRTGEEDLRFVAFSTSYGVGAGSWRWREPGYAGYGGIGTPQAARLSPAALPPGGRRGGDPHEAARSR